MKSIARSRVDSISKSVTLIAVLFVLQMTVGISGVSAGTLDLEPCDLPGVDGARCGSLSVKENPSEPEGRSIDLRVVVLDATGGSPQADPIFFLAGGPGTAAGQAAPMFNASPLRRDRAFVLVDQRGTGGSNPLHCDAGTFAESMRLMFSFDLSKQAAECAKKLSARADLRFYGTRQIVDDLDAVRRALGVSKINLLGGSYGTRVALQYLRTHGEHARSAILRGVAGPEVRVPLGFSKSSLEALRHLSADCKADEACGADFPSLESSIRRLRARLDETPLETTIQDPATGEEQALTVDGDVLAALVHYQLYGSRPAASIPALIKAAEQGEMKQALQAASAFGAQLLPRFHFGSFLAVLCAEDAPFYDEADVAKVSRDSLLRGTLARGILDSCREWSSAVTTETASDLAVPASFKQPVKSSVPVLLISGEADPVTPPSDAESASRHLENSAHWILPTVAHFSMFPGCSSELVERFLEQASVEGLDASCVSKLERPAFDGLPAASPRP